MTTVLRFALLAFLAAGVRQDPSTRFTPSRQDPDIKVFDEAWKVVKSNFYDKKLRGLDWDAMKEKYRPEAEKAKTQRELHAVVNRMIGELKASHCVLIEADVFRDNIAPEFAGKLSVRPGFELSALDGGCFVTAVYEKGPAETAGLKLGDRIVTIDGKAPDKTDAVVDAGSDPGIPGHPHFVVRVKEGEPLKLVVQRVKGGKTIEIDVTPEELSQNKATRDSARVIERGGKKIGVIHLWHFMGAPIVKALRDALANELAEVDGLVLDVRGRGGSPMVIQQVMSISKGLKMPLVCLIDEGSRSAKEVFAWQWRRDALGPLVGVKTAGAVLGSTFFKLSDGSQLLLAVINVDNLAGGVKLEGVGVEPDFHVERDVRYAAGRDEILEKGLEVMGKKLKARAEY